MNKENAYGMENLLMLQVWSTEAQRGTLRHLSSRQGHLSQSSDNLETIAKASSAFSRLPFSH